MAELKKELNFEICHQCHGLGRINRLACSNCRGRGMMLRLDDFNLFWPGLLDANFVFASRLKRIMNQIINIKLFVIGVIGLLAWSWRYWLVAQSVFRLNVFGGLAINVKFLLFIFWLSLLTDLYLFYRLSRQQERNREVALRPSVDFKNLGQPAKSQQTEDLAIDVSRSFSRDSLLALEKGFLSAKKSGQAEFTPAHLLLALLEFEQVKIITVRLEINYRSLAQKAKQIISAQPTGQPTQSSLTINRSLLSAYQIAYLQGKRTVDVSDLLLAVCQQDDAIADIFYSFKADLNKLKNAVYWIGFSQILRENWLKFKRISRLKPAGNLDRAMTALATPFLDRFSQNLTTMAKYGYFSPCIGRDREIAEILRTIEGGSRRNPVLVGDPGVGKTAIIEGIAQKMAAEEVPDILKDKRLMSLDIAGLVGGVAPEEAQKRLILAINEISAAGNIVLVIENLRSLTGIKVGEENSLDLSEILAQALSAGKFLCLATSNKNDYINYIESNSSLAGVFEPVKVEEVSQDGAIQILELKSSLIENKNKVFFSYNALARAVELSDRYIHDQYLPDKAINILSEAAVLVADRRGKNNLVLAEDVAEVISQATNIPATEISQQEKSKLLNLEAEIHKRVIGQDEAVKLVAASLRRARTELRSENRPIANFLFLGPTGVGKTELAKTVSQVYFGRASQMIRLDMSEYQDSSSISRLLGAGNQGGILTEAVRKNPFSMVLLDEIEKADPDILNLFLQVMDDGRLTDGRGRVIDFTNVIIIATSNAGTDFIQSQIQAGRRLDLVRKELIEGKLSSYFRPEFLNRFDGIIVFKPLEMDEVKQIAKIMINEVAVDLEKKGVRLEVTDSALAELAEAGFDRSFGARPLRRVIQERVRDVLANYILENKIDRRDLVVFDQGGQIRIEKASII